MMERNELRVLKRYDKRSCVAAKCDSPVEYIRSYPIVDVPAITLNAVLIRILVDNEERDVWIPKSQAVWRGNALYHDVYISPWIAAKKGL